MSEKNQENNKKDQMYEWKKQDKQEISEGQCWGQSPAKYLSLYKQKIVLQKYTLKQKRKNSKIKQRKKKPKKLLRKVLAARNLYNIIIIKKV